uniref:Uncharacterized protein n=1 Tax=Ciona savignyi TaxID=51511 RepID=H2YHG3_CIOSA
MQVSGREVFEFQPEMIGADDDEADEERYSGSEEETNNDADVRGISDAMFVPQEVDSSGTQAADNRLKSVNHDENGKLSEAIGGEVVTNGSTAVDTPVDTVVDVPVDEDLFTEDLDDLDAELEGLDV